jgi:hypothetical protein
MAHRWKAPKKFSRDDQPIVLPKARGPVYRYFSEETHVQSFLEGRIRFGSLSYYRDHEDVVRGDAMEGTTSFRPVGGLQITKQDGSKSVASSFDQTVRGYEIFVYCTSLVLDRKIAAEFNAVACVEITDVREFIRRIKSGLPPSARVRARPVDYYSVEDNCNPRWALPDRIAATKDRSWSWQQEYRFMFSNTDALDFEHATYRLVLKSTHPIARPVPRPDEHLFHELALAPLADICRLHSF